MQLDVVLSSLQDNSHVASLLGFTPAPPHSAGAPCRQDGESDTQLAEVLMKTLLRNLVFYTVRGPTAKTKTRTTNDSILKSWPRGG